MPKFIVKPMSRQRLASLAERGFVLAFIAIAGTIVYKETETHTDRVFATVAGHFERAWSEPRRGDAMPTVIVENKPISLPDLSPAGGAPEAPEAAVEPDSTLDTLSPY